VAVANAEFRFPLWGAFRRDSFYGPLPIEVGVFGDAGVAWSQVNSLSFNGDHKPVSSVGAVVGATVPRVIGNARRAMPQTIILLPGVGAQGATPADVARAFTSGPASALVNASRSVIFAYRDGDDDWRAAAGTEAARLAAEIWAASGW